MNFARCTNRLQSLPTTIRKGGGNARCRDRATFSPRPYEQTPFITNQNDDKTLRRHTALHAFPLHGQPRPSLAGSAKCGKKGKDAATEKADEKHKQKIEENNKNDKNNKWDNDNDYDWDAGDDWYAGDMDWDSDW